MEKRGDRIIKFDRLLGNRGGGENQFLLANISSIFSFVVNLLNCHLSHFLLIILDYNYTGMVRSVLSLNDGTEYPMKDVNKVFFGQKHPGPLHLLMICYKDGMLVGLLLFGSVVFRGVGLQANMDFSLGEKGESCMN